ncbi:MAG: GxxExxY protein [Opitutales bacterium]
MGTDGRFLTANRRKWKKRGEMKNPYWEEPDAGTRNLGYALIGAAFEVYNQLGSVFLEEVYQEALEVELSNRGIPFKAQERIPVLYKGQPLQKFYIADLVVGGSLLVELKAVKCLAEEHVAQLLNYLNATNLRVGYLLNFSQPKDLEWKRLVRRLRSAKIGGD